MELKISETERQIIESVYIDVYVASNMPYDYPYKIVKPKHVNKSVVESCDKLIMDSGIGDDITNKEVLDIAEEHEADYVVMKDYLNDQEKTTKSIRDFQTVYQKHEYSGEPIIPLQPPHTEHYEKLGKPDGKVMLGGIKDCSVPRQIEFIQDFTDNYNPEYIHVLGCGMSQRLVNFFRKNPNIVDSFDCSTPEIATVNNNICDSLLTQKQFSTCKGKKSSVLRYRLAQYMVIQLNYVLSSFCDMEEYPEIGGGSDNDRSVFDV